MGRDIRLGSRPKSLGAAFALAVLVQAAAAAPMSTTPPAAGLYQCRSDGAGLSELTFGDPGEYAGADGAKGAYTFDAGSGRMAFTSGYLEGFFGAVFADGKVGLSSKPDQDWFYMTCQPK